MVLVLVFIGFLIGGSAAAITLTGGAGVLGALLAYSAFASMAVIGVALGGIFAPVPPVRSHPCPTPSRATFPR